MSYTDIGGMGDHGAPYESGEFTCDSYNCDEVIGEFGGVEVETPGGMTRMCEYHAALAKLYAEQIEQEKEVANG